MSKRYGRNQKRAHKAEIERLTKVAIVCQRNLDAQRNAARHAYTQALADLLRRNEEVQYSVAVITRELTREYSPKLRDAAETILAARRDSPLLRFGAGVELDYASAKQVVTVHGEIPALRYMVNLV